MQFEVLNKPTFRHQLKAIPREQVPLVLEKIELLYEDPRPDGGSKKKLEKYAGNVCRLRAGDYRVVYNYGDGWVALLGVRHRKDVYEDNYFAEAPSVDLDTVIDDLPRPRGPIEDSNGRTTPPTEEYLPVKIDEALLSRLQVGAKYYPPLVACRTAEDLISAEVPDDVRNLVFDAVMSPDLTSVLQQPTFVTGSTDDLLRYVEGDLPGFLLKLDPVQEHMVDWGMKGSGPTLVKGGPGTGKSTVALYRVQAIVRALQAEGNPRPRVLFTTYTKALASFSEQLLKRLLGPDARSVQVRTADSVVTSTLNSLNIRSRMLRSRDLLPHLREALLKSGEGGQRGGDVFLKATPRLSLEYLLEEIGSVIEARELSSLQDYMAVRRHGRRAAISGAQRMSLWCVYEEFVKILDRNGVTSYDRARRHAAAMVRAGAGPEPYDGVVIDEVQDLSPSALRLFVLLCAKSNRLFITADANQSIYGGTFRWVDVHSDLRFRGRTEVLRRNYRSTREIGEAAQSYLTTGTLDTEDQGKRSYVREGYLPAVRPVATFDDEVKLLTRFLRGASRAVRLGIGACAILVPTAQCGELLAKRLTREGVPASFMARDQLDLEAATVKVITLKSAKGLEFPVVALAGFVETPYYGLRKTDDPDEREEYLLGERRTLYVGMTRAMRTLLVVTPKRRSSPLFEGFEAQLWNLGAPVAV